MKLNWQIKPSKIHTATIVFLSVIPVTISISLQQSIQLIGLIIPLSLLLLIHLWRYTKQPGHYSTHSTHSTKQLSWEDGQWSFFNKEMVFSGVQSRHSFSLGLMMFLSIESENGQRLGLWLFPDNILSSIENLEAQLITPKQIGWCHLHCCFNLSN